VSNYTLFNLVYSEYLKAITPCPTRNWGVPLLVQPTSGFDLPKTPKSFLFVPLEILIRPFRCDQFYYPNPLSIPLVNESSAGYYSRMTSISLPSAIVLEQVAFLGQVLFHHGDSLLAAVWLATSDSALFPASLYRIPSLLGVGR
jgi:hypothetical protein